MRLRTLVDRLQPVAAHVEGRVGDADPLQAIADALATFPADEIVVAAGAEYSNRPRPGARRAGTPNGSRCPFAHAGDSHAVAA